MLTRILGRWPALTTGSLLLGFASQSALAASQTTKASATILQWIAVAESTPMNLATVAPPATGGTVVLTTGGAINSTGGFVLRGRPVAGAFMAHGLPNFPAIVTVSTGDAVTGPGRPMPLAVYTSNGRVIFDGAGELHFSVGAKLTVNANQQPGAYSGTYAVTVNF